MGYLDVNANSQITEKNLETGPMRFAQQWLSPCRGHTLQHSSALVESAIMHMALSTGVSATSSLLTAVPQ